MIARAKHALPRARTIRVAALLLGALWAAPAWAACRAPAPVLDYTVRWGGEAIGRQRVVFEDAGDRLVVRTATKVRASLLFLTLLDLEHDSVETWTDGAFRRFSGRTLDNGRETRVVVEPAGDGLALARNGEETRVPATALAGSLWCEDTLARPRQAVLLDLVKGRVAPVAVSAAVEEEIGVNGRRIRARRYDIAGALEREVWYDEAGRPVKVRFPSKLGPKTTLELD